MGRMRCMAPDVGMFATADPGCQRHQRSGALVSGACSQGRHGSSRPQPPKVWRCNAQLVAIAAQYAGRSAGLATKVA
jgi:hypothetical protein